MEPRDLLRWVEARRAAEERERLERRERGMDREWSVRTALALIASAGRLHGLGAVACCLPAAPAERVRHLYCAR